MKPRLLVLAVLALFTISCASAQSGAASAAPRSDSRTLTQTDITAATQTNLYDLIAAHRSRWLEARTTQMSGGGSGLRVYKDNIDIGGVDVLRTEHPTGVRMLRYYTPSEATARFNVRNIAAVIQIVTK